jgi:hypothetical protein
MAAIHGTATNASFGVHSFSVESWLGLGRFTLRSGGGARLGVGERGGRGVMSHVRFQVLFGPASVRPQRMGWPAPAGPVESLATMTVALGDWYGWRLIGANNRELGRSALTFLSYQAARRAIRQLKAGLGRLVRESTNDPATGRWGWRLDLDGTTVAISGRWYERDHDSRLGVAKFVALTAEADLTDGVVTLRERRSSGVLRLPMGGPR